MFTIVLGTIFATWASFVVSLATHNLQVWPFPVVFILTILVRMGSDPLHSLPHRIRSLSPLFWLTVVGWGLFLVKLFSQMLVVNADGIWAGGSNVWGDWAGHIGYIANWLYGANWPPQNPWYAGVRLSYPFLFDFTSAILVKLGLSLPWSLQLPGIVFGLAIVVLLFKLAQKLTGSAIVGAVAITIFMLSGGLGFVYLIPQQQLLPVPPGGVRELTHSYEGNIQWVNFVISEMVPQRGILMGITATLVVFLLWLESKPKSYFLAGVVAGLIPFFHAHTFMTLAFVSGVLFLLKPQRIWWYFFLPAGILALPQFAYFMPQVSNYSSGFMRLQWGWAAHVQHDNWAWFWFKNIGLMAILIPLFWLQAWFTNRRLFWLYLPFLLIFIACNIWVFQPWENDNSKLLRFWYLASAILVAWGLVKFATKNYLTKVLAIIALVVITVSGAVDATSWLNFDQNKLQMWSRDDIQLATEVKRLTPPTAVFLTNDNHNHWVVDLAGRKIVLGFRGWLWSWGINYSQREADVNKMFQGDVQTPQLLQKYHIDYVIIGPGEKSNFNANVDYYLSHYPLLLDRNSQQIFDVSRQGILGH